MRALRSQEKKRRNNWVRDAHLCTVLQLITSTFNTTQLCRYRFAYVDLVYD